jgi:RNA polymerase sigma-70 factor, ECF subfamily
MEQHLSPRDVLVAALAMRIQKGEQRLFNELVAVIEPDIKRYLRRRLPTKADMEDCMQNVLMKIFSILQKGLYRGGKFFALLFRIMQSEVNQYFIKRKMKYAEAELADIPDNGMEEAMKEEEIWNEVKKALNALPPKRKHAVTEHYMYNRSHEEIGLGDGKSATHISSACSKGIKDLAQRLTGPARRMAMRNPEKNFFCGAKTQKR